jgi:hypothetical protein
MIYKTQKRNTPVATLIKNYVNKKSGKVAESRNEIQRRFVHLDWKDQKKILLAFLDACKTDRNWAFTQLTKYWDKSFELKVKALWEESHEPLCARSIIRFFPISYVKENMHWFIDKRDYYFICLRFVEDPKYVIDKSRLSLTDYLSVLYHSGRSLSLEKATDIFFEIIHDICVKGFTISDLKYPELSGGMICITNLQEIILTKSYLYRMDLFSAVWSFDQWVSKVQLDIFNCPETQALNKDQGWYGKEEWAIKIARKYCYLALDDKYKQPSDTSINELLTSEDWKMLLSPDVSQEIIPSKIKKAIIPFDPSCLEEMVQNNLAIKSLIDSFELEPDENAVPF